MKIFKLCLISFFTILYMAVCPDAQAGRYAGSPNVYDGVDISHHNLIKSFPLKKIQFVYMKATEGSSHKDTKYKTYNALAKKHGMNVGSYLFFRPRVSVKKQFENFKTTADVATDKLVPMIDVETDFNAFTRKEYRAKLRELVDLFEDEYEVAPILYCTERTYRNILSSSFAECRIRLAGGQKPYTNEWTIWQTDNYLREADKAASQLDINVFNKNASIADLLKENNNDLTAVRNRCPKPQAPKQQDIGSSLRWLWNFICDKLYKLFFG